MATIYQTVQQILQEVQKHKPALAPHYTPGYRMWTRGDGARCKTANKLTCSELDNLWKELKIIAHKGRTLQVKDEFGSSPYHDAFIHRGLVFIRRSGYIQVASRSILRNVDVWRTRAATN